MNSLSQVLVEINPLIAQVAEAIRPYDDPEDKWVVVIDDEEVAWAATYHDAERSYYEILRFEREHVQRNPANAAVPPSWYNINTGEFTARVDRVTGQVSYEDK